MVSQEILNIVDRIKPLMARYDGTNKTKEAVQLWCNHLGEDIVIINPNKPIGGRVQLVGFDVPGQVKENDVCFLNNGYVSMLVSGDASGRLVLDPVTGILLKINNDDWTKVTESRISPQV